MYNVVTGTYLRLLLCCSDTFSVVGYVMCVGGFVVQVHESQQAEAVVEAIGMCQVELLQEGPAPGGGPHGCTTWND